MNKNCRSNTFLSQNAVYVPQVKVCGLTHKRDAVQCAALGVNAVGFVFYSKSPRYIAPDLAGEISRELPDTVSAVGVFVDEPFEVIMRTIEKAKLAGVQLHGQESPHLVERLRKEQLIVIKALFRSRKPCLKDASFYDASAFLVECGQGKLPGGNAETWNYSSTRAFGKSYPLILAGGLSPENIQSAVRGSCPDAVDVSSGVERRPGQKDLEKVDAFIKKLTDISIHQPHRRIF
jgi:phosphoribosylanthranilate isomerase